MKTYLKRILSLVLSVIIVFTVVGCHLNGKNETSEELPETDGSIVVSDLEINDALVTLKLNGIDESQVDINEINIAVEEIIVNNIDIKKIESIEVEVTAVNDEMVYLAYKNFVSYYGEDFDLKKFLIDMGIGTCCVIICVTLSLTGVGNVAVPFFGAITVSEFSGLAIAIGAAIDAAVSGYKAYMEGGDASYIIGHMLNGVADGFKWSAILAPLTGLPEGIKAIKAFNKLRKLPGLEDISAKGAQSVFKNLSKILNELTDNAKKEITEDVVEKTYKKLAKDLTEEVSEETFKNIVANKKALIDIATKYNPYDVSKDVIKAARKEFLKGANLTEESGKVFIKEIKNGTIKSISNIPDKATREYVEENIQEFCKLYGNSLGKEFIEESLKERIGVEALEYIEKSITSTDSYANLVKNIGTKKIREMFNDANTLALIQLKYGSANVFKLRNYSELYMQLVKNNNIDPDDVAKAMDLLMNGSCDSLEDIAKINPQLKVNMLSSREIIADVVKASKRDVALSGLLDDLAKESLELNVSKELAEDLLQKTVRRSDIEAKYGVEAYQLLLDKYNLVVSSLKLQSDVNTGLIEELTKDALKRNNISDEVVERILAGYGISEWGITNEEFSKIGNIVADYYRTVNEEVYRNYTKEFAEKRGEIISEFLKKYKESNTITNAEKYAGDLMEPSGDMAEFIKAKYGDIYMSKEGFVIFDDYAISRVEIPDLTGDEAEDIAKANLLHHGTQVSIPGYTWHHLEDGKTLILIPTDLHEAYRHTGGASLIREGLKGAY